MLTRDIKSYANISFSGSIISGDIGSYATVNCEDGVTISGDIGSYAKINCNGSPIISGDIGAYAKIHCAGTPHISGDVGSYAQITCAGTPVFTGDVGDYVKVNGEYYGASSHTQRANVVVSGARGVSISNVGGITFGGGSVTINGRRINTGQGSGGKYGVAVGGVFYDSIVPNNGVVEVTQYGVTTKYRGNFPTLQNGKLVIDGREITQNDDRIIRNNEFKSERRASSTHATVQSVFQGLAPPVPVARPAIVPAIEEKLSPEDAFLSKCSSYTKTYIESFKGKKSHSDIVKEMNLTREELELLTDCQDMVISMDIMDRPVMLNEQVYDLKTVIDFKGIDPQRVKFEPSHVQPFRKAVTDFENGIRKINEARKAKLEGEGQNEELVGAPGGPNFKKIALGR